MSKKDFSVALKYVEARPRSQRRKGAEARVSGISVVGSGASATDLSLFQANLISVTNNFTALKDLFDSMFEKDSDGNIHAKLSLWSSGGITAGGVGSGGSGGGGGISYNRLDSWADYSADKAGYVLSALLGKDLDDRVNALANAGYITSSYLAPYALRSEIPSLAGYATESWVSSNYQPLSTAINTANIGEQYVKGFIKVGPNANGRYDANELTSGGIMVNNLSYKLWDNIPTSNRNVGSVIHFAPNGETLFSMQMYIDGYSNRIEARTYAATGVWTEWERFAFTSDIPSLAGYATQSWVGENYLSKNGGTVNGSITATSFIGNLVGVADKSKVLGDYYGERVASANLDFTDSAVRKIIASSSMTTAKPPADGSILHFAWDNTGGWNHQLFITSGGNADPDKRMAWRAQHYGSWSEWKPIAFIDSNVASATKLATARYIFGQSFDGTKSITGNEKSIGLDSVNAINGDANSWVDKYSLKLESSNNAMTFMVDNTANSRKAMIQVGHHATAYAGYLGNLYLNPLGGNVAIGGKTADEKFHVHGNGKFTGALTANSLTIGGATITYDSVNEALCINGNMYALGGITAGGAGISAYTSLEARVARLEQQLNIS